MDAKSHVFVVDSGNMRVQHFMPAEDAEEHIRDASESIPELPERVEI